MAKKSENTEKSKLEPVTADTKKIETKFGTVFSIPGVKKSTLTVLLIGDAPLIAHNFSEKLRRQILDKHMGEASGGREKKDPIANFEAARYISSRGWHGIPASGLKACFVEGFGKGTGVPMTQARHLRVAADDLPTNLVKLIYPVEPPEIAKLPHYPKEIGRVPRCREDVVRNDSGVIDIRHRPEYWPWAVLVRVTFLPTICSERQLMQAIAMSGFKEGQCEWRPGSPESKSGSYGTFRIATPEEVALFERDELFANHDWSDAGVRETEETGDHQVVALPPPKRRRKAAVS